MNNLHQTILREFHRMITRRIYFVACIVLPLFSLVFMATIFGNGRMEDLPVGVVDADNTSASRNIIRMVEATPSLRVIRHYVDEIEAREAVKKKEVYGYLVIPSDFAEKVGNNEEVTLCYYYHNSMLSVGGELKATFEELLNEIAVTPIVTEAVALGEDEQIITSFLLPVSNDEYPVYNQNRNYTIYLSQPFYFVFLQILLLLVTTYALGSESKFVTSADWLDKAGGSIVVAVLGKLLPYSFIFIFMSLLANWVFFGLMQIPLFGSFWTMMVVSVLFVFSTQAMALFLYALFPVLGLIISVVSMFGSLGATLSGVTFPVSFMDTPVYVVSFFFPVRHFMEIVQSLLYTGGTFVDYWQSIVVLLLFLVPPIFLLPRLKNAIMTHSYEVLE